MATRRNCGCDVPNFFYGTAADNNLLAPDENGNVYVPRPTNHPDFFFGADALVPDPITNNIVIPDGWPRTHYSVPAAINTGTPTAGATTRILNEIQVPVVEAGATYAVETCWEMLIDIYNAQIDAPIAAAGQRFNTASYLINTLGVGRFLFTTANEAFTYSGRITEPFNVPAGSTLSVPVSVDVVTSTSTTGTFYSSSGSLEIKVQRIPCAVVGTL